MFKFVSRAVFTAVLLASAAASAHAAGPAPLDGKVLMRDVRALADDALEGRKIGTPGGAKARAYVAARFDAIGLETPGGDRFQAFSIPDPRHKGQRITGANVLGVVRGSKHPDQWIVVSAHYDHLGVKNGEIYNGADDDASGVAGILAVAERFQRHRPEHSILFVAFDGEEAGDVGSHWLVAHPPVPLDAILADVNLDMIGRGDKGELYVTGTRVNPTLKPYVEAAAEGLPLKVLFGHEDPADRENDWTWQSDHYAFAQKSKPFLYFGVEDHPDYHKPTDDPDKIPVPFLGAAATVVLRTVERLDKGL